MTSSSVSYTMVRVSAPALTDACRARGWSLAILAERSGVSENTLAKIMHGQEVAPRTLRKLAQALDKHPPYASSAALLAVGS
jgi:transcriptional regulator with XRE-family HTH domain